MVLAGRLGKKSGRGFYDYGLDRTVPALGKVGASLIALVLGAILSNAGIVPATSPVYDTKTLGMHSVAVSRVLRMNMGLVASHAV